MEHTTQIPVTFFHNLMKYHWLRSVTWIMLWGHDEEGLQGLWGLCFGHSLLWMRLTLIYSRPSRKTQGWRVRSICGISYEPLQVGLWQNLCGHVTVYIQYDALCIGHSPPPTFSRIYCSLQGSTNNAPSCCFQISSILYHEPSHLIMLPCGTQCELGSWETEQSLK